MRYETHTVRIGENVGPIDWSYDFRSHYNNLCTSKEGQDAACARGIARLRIIVERFTAGEVIRATNYGGSPRCGIYPVVDVGMYDGWPWWRPVPSVCLGGYLGAEWSTFCRITDIYDTSTGFDSIKVPYGRV